LPTLFPSQQRTKMSKITIPSTMSAEQILELLGVLDMTEAEFQELLESEQRRTKHTYVLYLIQVLSRCRATPRSYVLTMVRLPGAKASDIGGALDASRPE